MGQYKSQFQSTIRYSQFSMDVTCNRCGAEYDFEESLVSDRGTTVKCTSCGHLFKVFYPTTPYGRIDDSKSWLIRNKSGSIESLVSLGELTRLILESKYLEDDEISRTGRVWKRLGDISELHSFFTVSKRSIESTPKPPKPPKTENGQTTETPKSKRVSYQGKAQPRLPTGVSSSIPPRNSTNPSFTPSSIKPRERAPTKVMWSTPTAESTVEKPKPIPTTQISDPVPSTRDHKQVQAAEKADGIPKTTTNTFVDQSEKKEKTNPEIATQTSQISSAADDFQTDDSLTLVKISKPSVSGSAPPPETEAFQSNGSRSEPKPSFANSYWMWPLLMLSVSLAIFIFWQGWQLLYLPLQRHQQRTSQTDDQSSKYLQKANDALAKHRQDQFPLAIKFYKKALAMRTNDPEIYRSISIAYAVWAQESKFKQYRPYDLDVADSTSSDTATTESQLEKKVLNAKEYAEKAIQYERNNSESMVALSDSLRLTGDYISARWRLDKAYMVKNEKSAEWLRVASLLTIDESDGDLVAGIKYAQEAVGMAPELIRLRLLYAYCLIAAKKRNQALVQLNHILRRDPTHPIAQSLMSIIKPKKRPVGSDRKRSQKKTAQNLTEYSGISPQKREDPSPIKETRTRYESNIRKAQVNKIIRGEKLLEQGSILRAKKLFESIPVEKPEFPRAQNRLGYIALERGKAHQALVNFRSALQGGYKEAFIGLGEAFRKLGHMDRALSAYRAYVRNRPTGPSISIARRQIQLLKAQLEKTPDIKTIPNPYPNYKKP